MDMRGVVRQAAHMVTSDGVRLDADVWRPRGPGPWPVLLMRQPYGRSIASTVVYAHPAWYAAHGYLVVIQDVRGRGTSEGEFRLCESEQADGNETVAWAAALPGSSGRVGMYGFSYQGMTQLFAAAARPPALKAIAPAMAAWDVHEDFATQGGAFRLQAGFGWGCQLALETVRRLGDAAAHQAIHAASRAAPLGTAVPCLPPIAEALGRHGHYLDWLTEPEGAPYWARVSPSAAGAIDVPALHIGGWYDGLLRGTLACHAALSAAGRATQALVVGPWVHIPWSRHVGDRDFGPAAASEIDALQVRWFDHWLKDAGTWPGDAAPVSLFELGGGWRSFPAWPDGPAEQWNLASTGRAGMTEADGALSRGDSAPGLDVIVYDPWRPTPSVGGHAGYPPGPLDHTATDARSDVLTFTTAPLAHDLHLGRGAGHPARSVRCRQLRPARHPVGGSGRRRGVRAGQRIPPRGWRARGTGHGGHAGRLRPHPRRQPPAPVRRRGRLPCVPRELGHRQAARGGAADRAADHHRHGAPWRGIRDGAALAGGRSARGIGCAFSLCAPNP